MIKSVKHIEYLGGELTLFKEAVNWKDYFSKLIKPHISGDVLEVGAGTGINTQYLTRAPNLIKSWCFLEPDRSLALQIERNISQIEIEEKSIINGVITDINDRTFDTIIYIDVLEHIEDSVNEIQNAKRLLKQGGRLIILVPAYDFLYSEFDRKIGHFRRYNKTKLMGEISNILQKESLYYLDSMGFFASLGNKFVLHKDLPTIGNIRFWDSYLIPLSKIFDIVLFRSFGKSLIGIFAK